MKRLMVFADGAWGSLAGRTSVYGLACLLPILACGVAGPAEAARWDKSEYAIRWYVGTGGPGTVDEVLRGLVGSVDPPGKEVAPYRVQYYKWLSSTSSPQVPEGATPILRKRVDTRVEGVFEFTYKVRGDMPFDAIHDVCLLSDPGESKVEVDRSAVDALSMRQGYSFSCSSATLQDEAGLAVAARPCAADMVRTSFKINGKGKKVKVELWSMPGRQSMLEVSRADESTVEAQVAFYRDIAGPLMQKGVRPVPGGKTALASDCEGDAGV